MNARSDASVLPLPAYGPVKAIIQALPIAFAAAPWLPVVALYALSWRIGAVIGHWPIAWIDDPKFSAPDDLLSEALYLSVMPLLLAACIAGPAFIVVTALRARRIPWWVTLMLTGVFAAGWLWLRFDPGNRMLWFAD